MTTISQIEPIDMREYLEIIAPNFIRLKGHRIGLEHIVERYLEGLSPEQIVQDFPGVSLVQIYTVIAYYLHHQVTVEAYLADLHNRVETAYQEWIDNPSPATLRIRELKK